MNRNINRRGFLELLSVLPLHPFLFALYPIIALLAYNVSELAPSAGYRSLATSMMFSFFLLLIFKLIYRDWSIASLACSLILVMFYSYGHVYLLSKGISVGGYFLFRHRTLAVIWFGITMLILWFLSNGRIPFVVEVTRPLNFVGIFLLIFPLYQLLIYPFHVQALQADLARRNEVLPLFYSLGKIHPDVYYIILDGYGRSDVLRDVFEIDNSDFLNSLRGLGFYVADCSQSNYALTRLSVASTLNLNYLDMLQSNFILDNNDLSSMEALIRNNAVRRSLEMYGYKTVAFSTGFPWAEWKDADYYLEPSRKYLSLNEFEYLLVDTTAVRIVLDNMPPNEKISRSQLHRERILYVLETLPNLSSITKPKFIFAHLIIPHPPYVFGSNGESAERHTGDYEEQRTAYRDQVLYIDKRMQGIIPEIIKNSSTPPIILLASDHGIVIPTSPENRMKNFIAYYLPGVDTSLYPQITPVNSFRIVFDEYFGLHMGLLADKSYFSMTKKPYGFTEIPNTCK